MQEYSVVSTRTVQARERNMPFILTCLQCTSCYEHRQITGLTTVLHTLLVPSITVLRHSTDSCAGNVQHMHPLVHAPARLASSTHQHKPQKQEMPGHCGCRRSLQSTSAPAGSRSCACACSGPSRKSGSARWHPPARGQGLLPQALLRGQRWSRTGPLSCAHHSKTERRERAREGRAWDTGCGAGV